MKEEFLGFALDQADGRKFLAAYFPVNDHEMPLSRLAAYDVAKVDVVELGMKAADAFADGPTVTEAMTRALGIGRVSEARIAIETVRTFKHSTMGMIFGYCRKFSPPNPNFGLRLTSCCAWGGRSKHGSRFVMRRGRKAPGLQSSCLMKCRFGPAPRR